MASVMMAMVENLFVHHEMAHCELANISLTGCSCLHQIILIVSSSIFLLHYIVDPAHKLSISFARWCLSLDICRHTWSMLESMKFGGRYQPKKSEISAKLYSAHRITQRQQSTDPDIHSDIFSVPRDLSFFLSAIPIPLAVGLLGLGIEVLSWRNASPPPRKSLPDRHQRWGFLDSSLGTDEKIMIRQDLQIINGGQLP